MDILVLRRLLARYQQAAMALLALWIVFGLFVGGAQPVAVGLVHAPWDKLAHAGVFSVLSVALGLASGLRGWRMILLAVGGTLLVGVLDEWHQVFLPGRQAGWDDLAADAVGSLLGATLLTVLYRSTKKTN